MKKLQSSGGSTVRFFLDGVHAALSDWVEVGSKLVDGKFMAPDDGADRVRELRKAQRLETAANSRPALPSDLFDEMNDGVRTR